MIEYKQSCKPLAARTAPNNISANELIKATPLPVRGGSVIVRMKRRSTKPPLSAFGNIYPPFIVSYTRENVREKMHLKHQPRCWQINHNEQPILLAVYIPSIRKELRYSIVFISVGYGRDIVSYSMAVSSGSVNGLRTDMKQDGSATVPSKQSQPCSPAHSREEEALNQLLILTHAWPFL